MNVVYGCPFLKENDEGNFSLQKVLIYIQTHIYSEKSTIHRLIFNVYQLFFAVVLHNFKLHPRKCNRFKRISLGHNQSFSIFCNVHFNSIWKHGRHNCYRSPKSQNDQNVLFYPTSKFSWFINGISKGPITYYVFLGKFTE